MYEYSTSNSKLPRYNGKGGSDFIVFIIIFKAWLHTQGVGAVLDANFDTLLLDKESDCSTLMTATGGSGATADVGEKKLIALDESNLWTNSCVTDT